MIESVQYSLKKHLEDNVPELNKVIWLLADTKLTASDLPCATIEEIYSTPRNLDKLFQYKSELHTFQIDLRATTSRELMQLRDKIDTKLSDGFITLYDTSQPFPPPAIGKIRANVNLINNRLPDDISDTVNKYVVNIDFSVFVTWKLN